jgi:hypothetical protein
VVASPQKYWNKTITVRGHVRNVMPDPPGTTRGSYVLRDSSDADVTVVTKDLPAPGHEFTVTGRIEQLTPDSVVPVLREVRRRPVGEVAVAPAREAAAAPPGSVRASPQPAPAAVPPPAPAPPASASTSPASSTPSTVIVPASGVSSNVLIVSLAGIIAVFSLLMIVAFWPRQKPAPAKAARDREPWPAVSAPPPVIVMPSPRQIGKSATPAVSAREAAETRMVGMAVPALAAPTEIFLDVGASVQVTNGPDEGRQFMLSRPRISIGRPGSRLNEITLNDDTVSREHASIVYTSGEKTFRLINESTTNPARVNGVKVEEIVLNDQDVIQLGSSSLLFVYSRPQAAVS